MNETKNMKLIQCRNCINTKINYLQSNPEIGWCQECSKCRKCWLLPIHFRVEWDILIDHHGNTHRLCKDVCQECEKKVPFENDCECSQTADNRSVHDYIYGCNQLLPS